MHIAQSYGDKRLSSLIVVARETSGTSTSPSIKRNKTQYPLPLNKGLGLVFIVLGDGDIVIVLVGTKNGETNVDIKLIIERINFHKMIIVGALNYFPTLSKWLIPLSVPQTLVMK